MRRSHLAVTVVAVSLSGCSALEGEHAPTAASTPEQGPDPAQMGGDDAAE